MRIRSNAVSISRTLIDSYLWDVLRYLRGKLGVDGGDRALYPLKWYIDSGRASADYLGHLIEVRPYVIGRLLMVGGSVEDALKAVRDRIYR